MRILDLYDDPNATVLRQHLGRSGGQLDKLASFAPTPSELAGLPDRLFALVGEVGDEKIRKYAMHDEAHLSTSILYFLECGGQLPEPVRAKVANNLLLACGWYDTPPPLALTKVAVLGQAANAGLSLLGAPSKMREIKGKNMANDSSIRAAQMSGVKEAAALSTSSESEAIAKLDAFIRGDETVEDQTIEWGDNYPNLFLDPAGRVREVSTKEANLTGTEAGISGGLSNDPRTSPPQKRFAQAAKVSAWNPSGTFEYAPPQAEVMRGEHFALPDRELYPIDTVDQVKMASDYFQTYQSEFLPEDRRLFAVSVAERAEELGVGVPDALSKIASNTYGPYIRTELQGRINALEGTDKSAAYEVLLENLDRTPPVVMFDMLKKADDDNGLDQGYGRPVTGFREPLSAVFGAPEKPIYSWSAKGAYVTEEQIRSLAKLVPDMDKMFGKDWTSKFVQDPIKEFEKLPEGSKIVVARLANNDAFRYI